MSPRTGPVRLSWDEPTPADLYDHLEPEGPAMQLVLTIDTDRLAKYGDPTETAFELIEEARRSWLSGGRIVWTRNAANVGTMTLAPADAEQAEG